MSHPDVQSQQPRFRVIRDGFYRNRHWHEVEGYRIRALSATVRVDWIHDTPDLSQLAQDSFKVAASTTPEGRYAAYYGHRTYSRLLDGFVVRVPGAEAQLRLVLAQIKFRRSYYTDENPLQLISAAENDIASNVGLQDATDMIAEVYGDVLGVKPPPRSHTANS